LAINSRHFPSFLVIGLVAFAASGASASGP
jgi:hypothetical protein